MTLWNFSNRTRNTQICVHIRECWYARIACNSFRWWCLNILINISSILWAGTRAGSFSRRRTPQCFRSAVICPSLFLFVAFSTTRLFSRACHVRLTLALTQKRHAIRRLCPFCAVANFFVLLFSYPCLFYGKKKKKLGPLCLLVFPQSQKSLPIYNLGISGANHLRSWPHIRGWIEIHELPFWQDDIVLSGNGIVAQ